MYRQSRQHVNVKIHTILKVLNCTSQFISFQNREFYQKKSSLLYLASLDILSMISSATSQYSV
jgi:hypothetical protein